jgi:hypothetical protein
MVKKFLLGGNIMPEIYTSKHTGAEIDEGIDKAYSAAPQSTTYSKTETDQLLAGKANSSSLAAVATSGNYNDLSNKPTLGAAASRGVDTTATSGSTNLITSGGVYTIVGDINTVLESVL